MLEQKQIREDKRQVRKAINPEAKKQYSEQACNYLTTMPAYQAANSIACYLALPEEISTQPIIEHAWEMGKKVYLPVVIAWGQPLMFAPYEQGSVTRKDLLDIDIPDVDSSNYIHAEALDFVVTPLVAFDLKLNRIGIGGGFYDRTFAFTKQGSKTLLTGLAFEAQKTSIIMANDWDVSPHSIITEKAVYSS